MFPHLYPPGQSPGSAVDWGSSQARGLHAAWDFLVAAGLKAPDLGAHRLDGVLTPGGGVFPAWTAGPGLLPALSFSNTSGQVCAAPLIPAMLGQDRLSLCFWANRAVANAEICVGMNTDSSNQFVATLHSDGNNYFAVFNGAGSSYGSFGLNTVGWRHYAVVFDGTQPSNATRLIVYVNGVPQSLGFGGSIIATTTLNGSTFNIGSDPALSRWGNGQVADVRLYRAALSPTEVREIYQSPSRLFLPRRLAASYQGAVASRRLSGLVVGPAVGPPPY